MRDLLHRYGFIVFDADDGSGSGSGGGGDGTGGDGGGDGDEPKLALIDGKPPTEADLKRMMKAERDQGKRSAAQELASKLGIPVDEAVSKLKAIKDQEDANASEADRAVAAAKAREDAAAERERSAIAREHAALAMAALTAEGVVFERDDDGNLKGKGARLLSLVKADLDGDATAETIAAAVAAVKLDTPELFGASAAPPVTPSGLPPVSTNGNAAQSTELDEGAKQAAARNAQHAPFDALAEFAPQATS